MKTIIVISIFLFCTCAYAIGLIGETSVITMNITAACSTKDDHDSFVQAQVSGDKEGIVDLILKGRCFLVKKGEQVLVIDNSWTITKVRMRSGPEQGKAGWVYSEAVR